MFQVKLEIFEGPLHLLLHLVEKSKLDIHHISIAKITHDYLEYLSLIEKLDLDVASDFLIMAARLMEIKARALLPKDEKGMEEAEDSEDGIKRQLIECKKYRDASFILRERLLRQSSLFMRVDEGIEEDGNLRITLLHLLNTFREVMSREKKRGERTFEVSWEKLSLSKKIKELNEIFKRVREIEFYKLFDGERKIEVIITLLAILELVRLRKVSIHQRAPFSEIWITRKDFSC